MTKRRKIIGLILASCGALVLIGAFGLAFALAFAHKAPHVAPKTPAAVVKEPSVKPSPTPEVTENPSAKPVDRLQIPAIGVNAPIISIGLTSDGSLDAPKTLYKVGIYTGGPWPGQNGTAIVDGHSGSPVQHGVLEHINKLKIGDLISVVETSGKTTRFAVTATQAYPAVASTAGVLFAKTTTPTMNLISCYGNWNDKTQEFDQRWIVKAALTQ